MEIQEYMQKHGHEQLVLCSEPSVGLRAFIAIHDTTLGPAVGGVRIWPYETEDDAMLDVLRLSEAMTFKSASADLPLGGGKAVILAGPTYGKERRASSGLRPIRGYLGRPLHYHNRHGLHVPRPWNTYLWRLNMSSVFPNLKEVVAIPQCSPGWESIWG